MFKIISCLSLVCSSVFVYLLGYEEVCENFSVSNGNLYINPKIVELDMGQIVLRVKGHRYLIPELLSDGKRLYVRGSNEYIIPCMDIFSNAYWRCPECGKINARGDTVCTQTPGCWGEPDDEDDF